MNVGKNKKDTIVIQPTRGWRHIDLREIWRYRELLYFLAWRDVAIKYKQTVLGATWAIIQPFMTMIIFSIFFGRFAKIPSEGIPYPVFVYTGLLPWMYFSQSLTRSSESVVSSANLIRKVYFPRVIIPLSSALAGMVDFCIAFFVLFGMMFYYSITTSASIFLLPLLLFLTFLSATGFGFWFAGLNALFRDVRYIIPFLVRMGLFITPVIYPVSIIPERYSWLLYLNPMAGLVETYRAIMLGYKPIPVWGLVISCVLILTVFISGVFFFRRMEKVFVDLV